MDIVSNSFPEVPYLSIPNSSLSREKNILGILAKNIFAIRLALEEKSAFFRIQKILQSMEKIRKCLHRLSSSKNKEIKYLSNDLEGFLKKMEAAIMRQKSPPARLIKEYKHRITSFLF